MPLKYLDDDIVDLRKPDGSTWQYYWGDAVEVLGEADGAFKVKMHGLKGVVDEGLISNKTKLRATGLLRLSMVDVQQGDGLIFDTPKGRVVFIDGGENQLFARHAAARYSGTSAADPLVVDAVIVTHGDGDHFMGLTEFQKSETHTEKRKRIFMTARRVYHNGLAKRPGSLNGADRPDVAMFGQTKTKPLLRRTGRRPARPAGLRAQQVLRAMEGDARRVEPAPQEQRQRDPAGAPPRPACDRRL